MGCGIDVIDGLADHIHVFSRKSGADGEGYLSIRPAKITGVNSDAPIVGLVAQLLNRTEFDVIFKEGYSITHRNRDGLCLVKPGQYQGDFLTYLLLFRRTPG